MQTERQIKKILYSAGTDVEATLFEENIIFYCDAGNVNVTTDKFYHFETWEEMQQQPIFWGKRFSEIVKDLILYW